MCGTFAGLEKGARGAVREAANHPHKNMIRAARISQRPKSHPAGIYVPGFADRFGHMLRSVEQRRGVAAELSAEGFTNRAIADVLGVHHDTVAQDKLALAGGNPPLEEDDQGESANGDGGNPPLTQTEAATAAGEAAAYDYLAQAEERGETPSRGLVQTLINL